MALSVFSLFRCCYSPGQRPKKQSEKDEEQTNRGDDTEAKKPVPERAAVGEQDLEYRSSANGGDEVGSEASEMTSATNTSEMDGSKPEDSSLVAPGSVQVQVDGGGDGAAAKSDIGVGGRLNLALSLTGDQSKLVVKIASVEFPPFQEWKMSDLEVSCTLLPIRQHSFRARPQKFAQPFQISLGSGKKDMSKMALRFRLYDHRAMSKKHMIGQGVVSLGNLKLSTEEVVLALNMSPPDTYAIDGRYISDVPGHQEGEITEEAKPEVLFSLEYRALTRKLIVEIIKTRNIGLLTKSKPHDLAMEVKFLDDKNRVQRICNTNSKRHVIDTEFNEMFMFRVTADRLHGVTLVASLIANPDGRTKKEKIGEVCLGRQSSSHEQQEHWDAAVQNPGSLVMRWHSLFK